MEKTPEERFISFMTESVKVNGFDDLTSKAIGVLYIQPREISLEELASKTGYSHASISTAMKFMERIGLVRRIKKPRSRKVYFFMEKDIIKKAQETLKRKYELIILRAKEEIPELIKDYKKSVSRTKDNEEKEKLRIIEDYLTQVLKLEEILKCYLSYHN